MWIDTHCHLDATEFDSDRQAVIDRARLAGVSCIVVPAVTCAHFEAARDAALAADGVYALGVHPLYVHDTPLDDALATLDQALHRHRQDPRLVAVGEIGLDHFVPAFNDEAGRALQQRFYLGQLKMAQAHDLPVILHVRRSADTLLAGLRQMAHAGKPLRGGIAHAFNGSAQQSQAFIDLGFKLGFGGAMTFERALQIRRLAATLPREAIVLETDAPDIPPQWLYATAQARAQGARTRNEPAELPRIAQTLAALWQVPLEEVARVTTLNARAALRIPPA